MAMTPTDAGTDTDSGKRPEQPDARIYRVLGEQFLEPPTRDRLDAIGVWVSEWRCNASSLPPAFDDALCLIEDGAQAEEELRTAFTHLFRGVSEDAGLKPPYESLHRDGQLYGQTTLEIQRGYRSAGFEVASDDRNEVPDHLGLELQFLGELLAMGGRDDGLPADRADDAIRWFLDDHLMEWLPQYQRRFHEVNPHPFYEGIVDLTVAVVKDQHRRLIERGRTG